MEPLAMILFILLLLLAAEGIHVLIVMTKDKGIVGFLLFFVPIYPWYFVIKNKKRLFEKDWAAIPWVIGGIIYACAQIVGAII